MNYSITSLYKFNPFWYAAETTLPTAAIASLSLWRCYLQRVSYLIVEFSSPDRSSTSPGARGVPALNHETLDVAMKDGAIVVA